MKIFDTLTKSEQELLVQLEDRDTKERDNNVATKLRLRQIPRETGEALYGFITQSSLHKENWVGLEIGSSGGYSTIWQALALRNHKNGKFISLEIDPVKVKLATANLSQMRLQQFATVLESNAFNYLKTTDTKFDYVFLDAEKSDYLEYVKSLTKCTRKGAICIVDNVISHADELKEFISYLEIESTIHYTILTIGKGLAFIEFV